MSRFATDRFWALLLCLLLPLAGWGQGKSREQLERDRKRIEREVNLTRRLIVQAKTKQKRSLAEMQLLQQQIVLREKLVTNIAQEVEALENEMLEMDRLITAMRGDVKKLQQNYGQIAYKTYSSQTNLNTLLWVLSSESFQQAYDRLRYFSAFSRFRKQQIFLIKQAQVNLDKRMRELNQRRSEKQELLSARQKERQQLDATRAEKDRLFKQLKQKESGYNRQLTEYKANLRKINAEIERLIREEIERAERAAALAAKRAAEAARKRALAAGKKPAPASAPVSNPVSEESLKMATLFERNRGKLPWPIPQNKGVVTSGFGIQQDVSGGKVKNDGVILTVEPGTEVRAVFGGKVTLARKQPGLGTIIILRHGSYLTTYVFATNDLRVKEGDEIETLQTLGTLQEGTGGATLNFLIYNQRTPVDPLQWVIRRN